MVDCLRKGEEWRSNGNKDWSKGVVVQKPKNENNKSKGKVKVYYLGAGKSLARHEQNLAIDEANSRKGRETKTIEYVQKKESLYNL